MSRGLVVALLCGLCATMTAARVIDMQTTLRNDVKDMLTADFAVVRMTGESLLSQKCNQKTIYDCPHDM